MLMVARLAFFTQSPRKPFHWDATAFLSLTFSLLRILPSFLFAAFIFVEYLCHLGGESGRLKGINSWCILQEFVHKVKIARIDGNKSMK